jgi:hypothetical protein
MNSAQIMKIEFSHAIKKKFRNEGSNCSQNLHCNIYTPV